MPSPKPNKKTRHANKATSNQSHDARHALSQAVRKARSWAQATRVSSFMRAEADLPHRFPGPKGHATRPTTLTQWKAHDYQRQSTDTRSTNSLSLMSRSPGAPRSMSKATAGVFDQASNDLRTIERMMQTQRDLHISWGPEKQLRIMQRQSHATI